ncbi:hypothetical protein [Methylobacterium platani]|uniref:Uncharacterized protein n=2 Tax=Methylobacterium platani TaxID=427683 RepID=A0A179S6H7_9HYPH|nr:hypothetical protein [Methylobacterium platani]KMO22404.1 hypothetical protein SQ03_00540 [Methylobacterium platani JCM 14648]OAS22487.1 hypothetical protein A5481_19010 [Methylobacterium platani]
MTLLQPPSDAGQLRVSNLLLVSALSRAGDDALLADGVRVVADMMARVASGELDAKAVAADAGRLARSLLRTGSHHDPACH